MGAIATYHKFERIKSIAEWMTGANFALCTGFNTQNLIHEIGHAIAALSVYKNPRPVIEMIPFGKSITHLQKSALNNFGKMIGPAAATCIKVASGPLLALSVSTAIFAMGLALKNTHPILAKYLVTWGLVDFCNLSEYAYSALAAAPSDFGHDFVHLKIFGLNPTVAVIAIVAIPILITAARQILSPREPEL